MAWNEPDDKGNDKKQDPWSGKQRKDGPPDLDLAIAKFMQRLGALFGIKAGNSGGNNGRNTLTSKGPWMLSGAILLIILVTWGIAGIYIVQPAEQAVVLRFGRYLTTTGPGPHWRPLFVDTVYKIDVQKVYNFSYNATMLTKDENIVDVGVAVQYRIANPQYYLFNVVNPRGSIQLATASALRQVVGDTTLNAVLTTGRSLVSQEVTKQLEKTLQRYRTGLLVTDVALQSAQAPQQVRAAFDDAIKAREDEQRYINQAKTYQEQVVQKAQGQAKQMMLEAQAYQQQVVLGAKGETAGFLALLPEYKQAPKVTRERLYLNTVETVLSKSSKVLVDNNSKGSQNLMLLPLNKLIPSMLSASDAKSAAANKASMKADADSADDSSGGTVTTTGSNSSSTESARPLMRPTRGVNYGYGRNNINYRNYQGGNGGYR